MLSKRPYDYIKNNSLAAHLQLLSRLQARLELSRWTEADYIKLFRVCLPAAARASRDDSDRQSWEILLNGSLDLIRRTRLAFHPSQPRPFFVAAERLSKSLLKNPAIPAKMGQPSIP